MKVATPAPSRRPKPRAIPARLDASFMSILWMSGWCGAHAATDGFDNSRILLRRELESIHARYRRQKYQGCHGVARLLPSVPLAVSWLTPAIPNQTRRHSDSIPPLIRPRSAPTLGAQNSAGTERKDASRLPSVDEGKRLLKREGRRPGLDPLQKFSGEHATAVSQRDRTLAQQPTSSSASSQKHS
jgi:hypothetical protein